MRGDFTRKFDKEILKDKTAEEEEDLARKKKADAENARVETEIKKCQAAVDRRAPWLKQRFDNMTEPKDLDFRGRRFIFVPNDKYKHQGSLEFKVRPNESRLAVLLECTMEIPGRLERRNDYVTFPIERVDEEKAKLFVENKLFEFAQAYMG